MKRSDFLKTLGLGALGTLFASGRALGAQRSGSMPKGNFKGARAPISIGTWPFAEHTTRASLEAMQKGANALDAVELGVKICEADPRERSVGLGGRPDRDGRVTLDACIMDHRFCGCMRAGRARFEFGSGRYGAHASRHAGGRRRNPIR